MWAFHGDEERYATSVPACRYLPFSRGASLTTLNGPLQHGDTATGWDVTCVAWTDHVRTASHPVTESNGPTIVGWLPGPGDHRRNHHATMVVNGGTFVPFTFPE